jgi:hypothetical protein
MRAPVSAAVQATTPTATTTAQLRRVRAPLEPRGVGPGMPGLTPGAGGGNEVMQLVYPSLPTATLSGAQFTPLSQPVQNAEIRSHECAQRNVGSEYRVVREIREA